MLSEKLLASGASYVDVSYSLYSRGRALGTLCGVREYYGFDKKEPSFGLITVNGTMRRVTDGANPAEAKECVTKASELYAKTGKSVGIFTLTHGQAAYIKHLVDLNGESDKMLAEGSAAGFIRVFEPSAVCFDKMDFAIVSFGAAADKDGKIGWSYGCGEMNGKVSALSNAFRCAEQGVLVVSSLSSKELAKLVKISHEAEKLYFAIIAASRGLTVMDADCRNGDDEGLCRMMLAENEALASTLGRYKSFAEGYDAVDGVLYMYDCDMQGNVFDRLYCEMLLEEAEVSYKSVSVLDSIMQKHLHGKNE